MQLNSEEKKKEENQITEDKNSEPTPRRNKS